MSNKFGKNSEKFPKNDSQAYLTQDKSFQILKLALDEIKQKYNLSAGEILGFVEKKPVPREIMIPVSVFEIPKLSALEAVCKYLKEDLDLSFAKIADLTKRDNRTIWATYRNASRNVKEKLQFKQSKFFIPVSALANRKLSVMESIVSFLKDKFGLRYTEIAHLLNRNERNIWTVYNKFRKKLK